MKANRHQDKLAELKPGDHVMRLLSSAMVPVVHTVVEVTEDTIICGALGKEDVEGLRWTFHRKTGAEIDHELGFDGLTRTGSILDFSLPLTACKNYRLHMLKDDDHGTDEDSD